MFGEMLVAQVIGHQTPRFIPECCGCTTGKVRSVQAGALCQQVLTQAGFQVGV